MYSSRSWSPVTAGGNVGFRGGLKCPPHNPGPPKLTVGGSVADHQVGWVPLEVALNLLGRGDLERGGKWGSGGHLWGE